MRIGVFDSGFGGLTVLGELLKTFPRNDFVYLGDGARAPYGNRPQEEVERFAIEAVAFLAAQRCSIIIIACNTVSSEALRIIQQRVVPEGFPGLKVLGVLIPSAETVRDKRYGTVGVIGTVGTIKSRAYEREIAKVAPAVKVIASACPKLAGLIESGQFGSRELADELRHCLAPIVAGGADALILGCTHYPLVAAEIRTILPAAIEVISPPKLIAESFEEYLGRHQEIASGLGRWSMVQYFTTGSAKDFGEQGAKFLGGRIGVVKQIKL